MARARRSNARPVPNSRKGKAVSQLLFIAIFLAAFIGLSLIFQRIKDAYEETGP